MGEEMTELGLRKIVGWNEQITTCKLTGEKFEEKETRKVDKHCSFTVNLKHDGIFSPHPFSYINGDEKQITDTNFEVSKTLAQGLCNLNNDADVQEFLMVGYESKWVVDLYTEHFQYDAMDFKNSNGMDYESGDSSDAYCSSDDEVIYYVDFYHEREENVVIKNITTNDPFLTKLCSNHGHFRGFINEPIPNSDDVHMEDPDLSTLEPKHKVQMGIAYPIHNPLQPWNEMQPILGRGETSQNMGDQTEGTLTGASMVDTDQRIGGRGAGRVGRGRGREGRGRNGGRGACRVGRGGGKGRRGRNGSISLRLVDEHV
ncbi:hypothetical protein Tco_0602473 [Tanacetum coccineum]